MEFWVSLIRLKGKQSAYSKRSLEINCMHVTKNYYLTEEDMLECLENDGVKFVCIGEGIVKSLECITKKELIEIVDKCIGVDLLSKVKCL